MRNRAAWWWGIVFVIGVVAASVALLMRSEGPRRERRQSEVEPPPISASQFLNTSPGATYVGVTVCAECHADEHDTYRQTAHSLALSELDPSVEPPDTRFFHSPSGRTYTVYHEGGQLRHREAVLDDEGQELVAADWPILYLIGSGRHTRSYLVEDESFLVESPVTWYASRQNWGLSPGYDGAHHPGFERAADVGCVICHVGRIDAPHESHQRVKILEQPIGCERCHGPGSLHVAEERSVRDGQQQRESLRPSNIVNPARLSRSLVESICSQCHLRGSATVFVRGRRTADFRPGLPLSDFVVNYHLAAPDSTMKVVGHVEQLRQSRCYLASDDLSCRSCHAAHAPPHQSDLRDAHVRACLKCHTAESCGQDLETRLRKNPRDDCVACHMPQVETDIPHIAFTHHRIGVHVDENPRTPTSRLPELVPFDDVSHLSEIDRDRNLGLAYLELSRKEFHPAAVQTYTNQAVTLLERVRRDGLSDPEVTSALAQISWEHDPPSAFQLAREALTSNSLSPRSRVNALFIVGDAGLNTNQIEAARLALEELVTLRRMSEDWLLLAECRRRSNDLKGVLQALTRAAAIAPFRPDIHAGLASTYEQAGDKTSAEREHKLARALATRARRK